MPVQGSKERARWKATVDQAGVRLETFVRQCLPHLSRRESAKAIAENAFSVNGRPAKKGDRLSEGDIVTFDGAEHWLAEQPAAAGNSYLTIVYEDTDVLVVDKPAGMATHGFSGQDSGTLANVLIAWRPELSCVGNSRWEPGLVNRLDRETSGLLLVAKHQQAFGYLREQFRRRQIKKKYWALVWGDAAPSGSISIPLAHDSSDKARMQVLKDSRTDQKPLRSWRAVTRFRKLATTGEMSLLEIAMETGVTHQIRVHLAAAGHAIVGDALYGTDRESLTLGRHFLHACRLEFAHPASGETLGVDSPLPAELRRFLRRVKMNSLGG